MKSTVARHAFTLVFISLLLAGSHVFSLASASTQAILVLRLNPLGESEWNATFTLIVGNSKWTCSNTIIVNPYYVQTKTISDRLLVAPLYYIGGNCAVELRERLDRINSSSIIFRVDVPPGYVVRSALDWRGFGSLGGPYKVPLEVFKRFYIYDGIVVGSENSYSVIDGFNSNTSIVACTGYRWRILAEALVNARSFAEKLLGPSPRSPIILVISCLDDHEFMLPGSGHSLGSIVYIKPDAVEEINIHIVFHEAMHGWLNPGLLYGSYEFVEATVEYLARLAANHSGYLVVLNAPVDFRYQDWYRILYSMAMLSEKVCGDNIVLKALKQLVKIAFKENGVEVTLTDFAEHVVAVAPPPCKERLRKLYAVLLGVDDITMASKGDSSFNNFSWKTVTITITLWTRLFETITQTVVIEKNATIIARTQGDSLIERFLTPILLILIVCLSFITARRKF